MLRRSLKDYNVGARPTSAVGHSQLSQAQFAQMIGLNARKPITGFPYRALVRWPLCVLAASALLIVWDLYFLIGDPGILLELAHLLVLPLFVLTAISQLLFVPWGVAAMWSDAKGQSPQALMIHSLALLSGLAQLLLLVLLYAATTEMLFS